MEFSHIAILIMQMSTMRAVLASSREKFFWSGLWIYSLATGLASMIFMAWAFYVESVLGRGALFIEPNRILAASIGPIFPEYPLGKLAERVLFSDIK